MSKRIDLNHLTRESGNRIAVVMVAAQGMDDPVAELVRRMEPADHRSVYVVAPDLSENTKSDAQAPVAEMSAELRFHRLSTDELSVAQGCLCCSFRSELNVFLGQLFMSLLARREPVVKAVFVVTSSPDPALLEQSLIHAPFLAQRYVYSGMLDLA
ncbi:hypothetical protein [Orrella marina]|uniref:hypothetical protein n=1 Tax=Orrella marina TaxID=2163011 RepID=UPI00131F2BF4|nr:hypothetical protein [Orrella marina]